MSNTINWIYINEFTNGALGFPAHLKINGKKDSPLLNNLKMKSCEWMDTLLTFQPWCTPDLLFLRQHDHDQVNIRRVYEFGRERKCCQREKVRRWMKIAKWVNSLTVWNQPLCDMAFNTVVTFSLECDTMWFWWHNITVLLNNVSSATHHTNSHWLFLPADVEKHVAK